MSLDSDAGSAAHRYSVGVPDVPTADTNEHAIAPLVSILIPVHNRVDLTRQCLESLAATASPRVACEIIVIDDASSDGTQEYLSGLGDRIRVLRNFRRRSFAHNMNRGAREAGGKYLCLLNNDTILTRSWLEKLVETAESNSDIGIVGNKHLWPDSEKVNHAGMGFDERGFPVHLYPGADPSEPCVNISRDFTILTAACWLIARDLFLEMGGLDEAYQNGFEDVDFCLRMRQRDKRVYYCHESVIYHYGQSSPGRKDHDQQNWETFQARWGGTVRTDIHDYLCRDGKYDLPCPQAHPESEAAAAQSVEVTRSRPADDADLHLAVALDVPNSFTWVVSQLALALEDIGLRPSLKKSAIHRSVGDSQTIERLRTMMRRTPSSRFQVKWTHYGRENLCESLSGDVNAEIFVTNYLYGNHGTSEIDRWMRHVVMNGNRKLPLSQYCRDALLELGVNANRTAVLPLGYSPEALTITDADTRFRKYGRVLFAVINSYDPERNGADLLFEAYGRAFQKSDDVVLVVRDYGAAADREFVQSYLDQFKDGPRIEYLPEFLSKSDLIRLYRGADAFVAPFRGEGFGMKVLDACAVGVPVVAPIYGGPADYLDPELCYGVDFRETPVGPCFDRTYGVVPPFATWCECDVDDLAAKMRAAIDNPDQARDRARRLQQRVLERYSWQRAAEKFHDAMQQFLAERDATVQARRIPSDVAAKRLSVVIPTYNRGETLAMCLDAYREQTLPADQYEIVLVDDGSNYSVSDLVAEKRGGLNVRLFGDGQNRGPAAARNLGIEQSRGDLVLITGDDIIPQPNFLAEHLDTHARHARPEVAVLGNIVWHKDLKLTPLMQYVTSEGGQQFSFDVLSPGKFVPSDYFYTSNVSVKRSFLIEHEELFSTWFSLAAYEDVEFAARLAASGMRLFYHPQARAAHYHPMTDEQILRRQYRVGRMLSVYALLHPQRIPIEHERFIEWLEIIQQDLLHSTGLPGCIQTLEKSSLALDQWLQSLAATAQAVTSMVAPHAYENVRTRDWLNHELCSWRKRVGKIYAHCLDLAMRSGMADEWMGVSSDDPNPARDFIRLYQTMSVWDLFGRSHTFAPPVTGNSEGRTLNFARRLKSSRAIQPMWSRIKRMQNYPKFKRAVLEALTKLP